MEGNTFFLVTENWSCQAEWNGLRKAGVRKKIQMWIVKRVIFWPRQWQENYPSPSSLVHVKIEAYEVHFKTNLYSWIPRRTNFAQPQIVILEEGEKFMEANVIIKRVTSPRLRERTRGQWPYSACVKPISMLWTEMWFANELLSNIL